ncbi:hypothetical protein ALQ03_101943 [Pseudomonas savastanoi pv. glycinea]|uniref:Uncharacterized protein n=2 Tax=Pseudomonas savastanoi TaxID=29438 RepID=A0A0P9RLE7_PSESG|nr:hypothetical protein ALO37_101775 [Pseudomonas savastanoi pv. glycinea]KPY11546.1 hypothetical protein ALO55_101862 [Pseudomonas savastanoi pv. phaseolicola]MBN4175991.1 hypothetical protein [Pseudomonas savastanoi pv. phaseolicola]RMM58703.1 hypothetical protein ALQ74_101970 [Pseudomonas savastanoi pv. glycinea]RMM62526.1 hypothetical protein ALQ73_101504 [Pseudomonas savastanoi pv. glycinea]
MQVGKNGIGCPLFCASGVIKLKANAVSYECPRVDLAILSIVKRLCLSTPQKLTFGQIYRELVRAYARAPAIHVCVGAVDTLVREGLLISARVLEPDQSFPYTQHIISGLTEIGAASLASCEDPVVTQRSVTRYTATRGSIGPVRSAYPHCSTGWKSAGPGSSGQ